MKQLSNNKVNNSNSIESENNKTVSEMKKAVSSLMNVELPKVELEFGARYAVNHNVAFLDTRDIIRICNKFCEAVKKKNIQVQVSSVGKSLPEMNPKIPYVVIESSFKGILNAKKALSKRNYTTILKDDFIESNRLALMMFKVLE